jgi:hypothetical protein
LVDRKASGAAPGWHGAATEQGGHTFAVGLPRPGVRGRGYNVPRRRRAGDAETVMPSPADDMRTLPADLQDIAVEIDAITRETDALLDPLDDEQFNWSPRPGAWSIGQCFDHLNVINAVYFRGLEDAIARARQAGLTRRGPIQTGLTGRLFIWSLEPPARLKVAAPAGVRPADRRHKAEVWPEFVRFHAHLRSFLAACAEVDVNRARFPNPFMKGISVRAGTALRILTAHDRRHVWQATRVREAVGFPRS